jgi:hypothetical protein
MIGTEADTCRKLVVPKLLAVGWDTDPHSIAEQRTITDRRIVPVGKGFVRKTAKRVDFLLRYTRDFPLAASKPKPSKKRVTLADLATPAEVPQAVGSSPTSSGERAKVGNADRDQSDATRHALL